MMRMSVGVIGRSTSSLSIQVAPEARISSDDVANAVGLLGRAVLVALRRHEHDAETRPGETAAAANALKLEARSGAKSSGVEEF